MSLKRINALLLQEIIITKRSLEVILDLFFFSIVSVVVFGFVSVFLANTINSSTAYFLLLGILLWEIVRICQYTITVNTLWNIWSHNLSNLFITPISVSEYLISQMLASAINALVSFVLICILTYYIFGFNILDLGFINLVFFSINLTMFSWSIGIVILAFIFRFGTRIQALAWGLVILFQPLTAAFFPLSILPTTLQDIAKLFPITFVFEAARQALTNPVINWQFTIFAFLENIFYLILSIWFFYLMFNKSKESGQFARMEG